MPQAWVSKRNEQAQLAIGQALDQQFGKFRRACVDGGGQLQRRGERPIPGLLRGEHALRRLGQHLVTSRIAALRSIAAIVQTSR